MSVPIVTYYNELPDSMKLFWSNLETILKAKNLKRNALKSYRLYFVNYCLVSDIKTAKELEDNSKVEFYIEAKKSVNKSYERALYNMALIINHIVSIQDQTRFNKKFEYYFSINVFDKYLKENSSNKRKKPFKFALVSIKNLSPEVKTFWLKLEKTFQKLTFESSSIANMKSAFSVYCNFAIIESIDDFSNQAKADQYYIKRKAQTKLTKIYAELKLLNRMIIYYNEDNKFDQIQNIFNGVIQKYFPGFTQQRQVDTRFKFQDFKLLPTEIEAFWIDTEPYLKHEKKLSPDTITTLKSTFKTYCLRTGIKNVNQINHINTIRLFRINREKENVKQATIASNFYRMSLIIQLWMNLGELEINTKYTFEKNLIQIYLQTYKIDKSFESHKPRMKPEVEIWIRFISNPLMKIYWTLLSIGLRKREPLKLTVEQFNFNERYILNVERKGRSKKHKTHLKVGLPNFCIEIIKTNLNHLGITTGKIFHQKSIKVTYWSQRHYVELMDLREEILKDEKKRKLPYWQSILHGLDLLKQRGIITPHQLRTTWDTISSDMNSNNRMYHLNHRLPGMDDFYVQIAKIPSEFKKYLLDLDNNSPQYNI